jgi:hypothetical protein
MILQFFFKNKVVRWNFFISLGLNLLAWLFLYWRIQPQANPIFLGYTIYWGVSLIGPWWQIFGLPLFGLLTILINYFFTFLMIRKDRVPAYFFIWATDLIQVLILIISIYLVLINS